MRRFEFLLERGESCVPLGIFLADRLQERFVLHPLRKCEFAERDGGTIDGIAVSFQNGKVLLAERPIRADQAVSLFNINDVLFVGNQMDKY